MPEIAPPCEPPSHYYVVSDGRGYVGAFYTPAAAAAIATEYPLIPLLVQRFAVSPAAPPETVWVVILRELDSVAFVSNDRAEAARVQEAYGRLGLAYPDSIDYWEQPANTVARDAALRLKTISDAHRLYASPPSPEELAAREAKDRARLGELTRGPLPPARCDEERITILDCIAPVSIGPVSTDPVGIDPDTPEGTTDAPALEEGAHGL
jgi:hypothetical protein